MGLNLVLLGALSLLAVLYWWTGEVWWFGFNCGAALMVFAGIMDDWTKAARRRGRVRG